MLITVMTTSALKLFLKNMNLRGPIKLIGFYLKYFTVIKYGN